MRNLPHISESCVSFRRQFCAGGVSLRLVYVLAVRRMTVSSTAYYAGKRYAKSAAVFCNLR